MLWGKAGPQGHSSCQALQLSPTSTPHTPHPPPGPAQALASYLEALLSHPTNIDALLGCASVYTASALLLEALKCLERARGLAPTRTDVLQALANVLTDLGTAEKLTRVPGWRGRYEAALEACPSHAQAHYNLGVAAGEEGRAEEAAAHYRDAVRAAPACAEAWCNLGVVLRSQASCCGLCCYRSLYVGFNPCSPAEVRVHSSSRGQTGTTHATQGPACCLQYC